MLQSWVRRRSSAQSLALRSRIVLESSDGHAITEVARRLGITTDTVRAWRRRFLERRLNGLCDEPRPGVPRKITHADVERVIVKTLEETPKDATHWSTRSMAAATGMSQSAISRIWRAFALQPHRAETFKLSKDPLFIDKVRDVVGLDAGRHSSHAVDLAPGYWPRWRASAFAHAAGRGMTWAGTRIGVGTRFRYDGESVEVAEPVATADGNEVVLRDGQSSHRVGTRGRRPRRPGGIDPLQGLPSPQYPPRPPDFGQSSAPSPPVTNPAPITSAP